MGVLWISNYLGGNYKPVEIDLELHEDNDDDYYDSLAILTDADGFCELCGKSA